MIFGIKINNFDPCNVFLAIATNIPQRRKTGFVLQGHKYDLMHHVGICAVCIGMFPCSLVTGQWSRVAVREQQVSSSGRSAAGTCVSASDSERVCVCVCVLLRLCVLFLRRLRHGVSAALRDLLLCAAAGEKILPDLPCSVRSTGS